MNIVVGLFFGLTQVLASTSNSQCIQIVPGGAVEIFWMQVKRGAEDASKELGYSIYYRGAKTTSDGKEQKRIVSMVERNGCKALILAPSANYDDEVEKLDRKGIPVVFIDRRTGITRLASLVATDNYSAGYKAGMYMAEKLGRGGRVVVLRLKKGVSSTDLREEGFIDAATASGLVIIDSPYIGDSVAEGRKIAVSILSKYSGKIDGVFSSNETTSSSLLLALEKVKAQDKMVNIGFDISQRLLDGLNKKVFTALVVQRPYRIGYIGVTTAVANIVNRGSVKFIDTGYIFLTPYNIKEKHIVEELKLNYPLLKNDVL